MFILQILKIFLTLLIAATWTIQLIYVNLQVPFQKQLGYVIVKIEDVEIVNIIIKILHVISMNEFLNTLSSFQINIINLQV